MNTRWANSGSKLLAAVMTGLAVGMIPVEASAQTCGAEYAIKEGDTLGDIAARVYGNPSQWTVIFYSNQDRLGANASLLVPGLSIRLPCIATTPAPAPSTSSPTASMPAMPAPADGSLLVSSMVRRMEVLTADGYAPYTGRNLEGGGMLTQVLTAAMDAVKTESKGRFDFSISWVNDWAAHLNPLLTTRAFDIGFPWARPNCEDPATLSADGQLRCQRFYFSDPLYEVVTTTFVLKDSRLTSLRTEEITGAKICRPTGYPISEFDQHGRNWLKDGKITLIRPSAVNECFRLLANGTVDAVALAELVGRATAAAEGMLNNVRELDPPLSLTSLHVIVSKSHPHARTMIYYTNAGLAKVRESGNYDRIVERHLARYWESQTRVPNPALATTPATASKSDAAKPKSPPAASGTATEPSRTAPAPATPSPATATAKNDPIPKQK